MTQEEIYLAAYIEKCAELGIDGVELLKLAAMDEKTKKTLMTHNFKKDGPITLNFKTKADKDKFMKKLGPGKPIKKQAGLPTELLGLSGAGLAAPIYAPANVLGMLAGGLAGKRRSATEQLEADKEGWWNMVPGVAGWNLSKRIGSRGNVSDAMQKAIAATGAEEAPEMDAGKEAEAIYAQAYMDKCAEYGIDGEELYKYAQRGATILKGLKKLVDPANRRLIGEVSVGGMSPTQVLDQLGSAIKGVGSDTGGFASALSSVGRGSGGPYSQNLVAKAKGIRQGLSKLRKMKGIEEASKLRESIVQGDMGALAGLLG